MRLSGVTVDATEDEVQLLCFAEECACFAGERRFGRGYHSEEILRLFRFLSAAANDAAKVLFRYAFIGFAVIRPDTRSAADELINEPVVGRVMVDTLAESNDRFTEQRGSFLEIEWMTGVAGSFL